ncbi:MAG: dihydrolipoyl dehydrogenase [Chlamydiae bacterium RIFCSPHIGHO2_12_FULL_49_9]|nr:MAG: dihydrolipoyl dehydrogenase [Chlamydiae bacterium RIFCSPHIGHO2_12_FULL_49_9]
MYDLVVIGSGPGGYVAAIRAAQLGLKTACIEKETTLGGTCLNVGCIPSKALLSSSELYYKMQNDAKKHGIQCGEIRYEFSEMMKRKSEVVFGFTKGIEGLFKKNKVDWIKGNAKLTGEHQIDVNGQTIEAKYIILATGSEPIALPFMPFDEKRVLSSTGALALTQVPKSMLIVGAGVIGVELGSVYSRLGSKVEFIEFLDRICPAFDLALSKGLQKSLTSQGMIFHLSQKVVKADLGKQVVLTLESGSQMEADAALVAIGRRPYSQDLGLDALGIKKDPKGFVQIDASFRTSIPHIFAIGDLVEGPMLAHKASEEGVAVAELIAGHRPSIDYIAIPNVAYTHPEVASVGFTEEELKKKGIAYKAAQFPFKANSRARCTGDDEGFVKILAEVSTKKLLGVHILGPNASELIGEATVAIAARMKADELASTCHAHPTLSEAIKEAAMSLFGLPIHL